MNEAEKAIAKAIDKHGCHITSVFDPDGCEPGYTYSTGLFKTYTVPELIVVGLDHDLAVELVNEYQKASIHGHRFESDGFYEGFLKGFEITFGEVSKASKCKLMLSACWFHDGDDFPALQLIYPDVEGTWPWAESATEAFRRAQPCLAEG